MSFETPGQEWFGKAMGAVSIIAIYAVGFIGLMYFIDACGPAKRLPECTCICDGGGK